MSYWHLRATSRLLLIIVKTINSSIRRSPGHVILGFHNQCVRFWALSTSIFRPCGRLLPLFETAAGDLATSADRVAADFLCECCAVSWRSLGRPVDDDEMLLRLVI